MNYAVNQSCRATRAENGSIRSAPAGGCDTVQCTSEGRGASKYSVLIVCHIGLPSFSIKMDA